MNWQKLLDEHKHFNDYLREQVKEKNAEISRLRKALEFYAVEKNWTENVTGKNLVGNRTLHYLFTHIQADKGSKARQALKE